MFHTCPQGLRDFLDNWHTDPCKAKTAFMMFSDFLATQHDVSFDFKARPGISYSLRASHAAQRAHGSKRELFVLMDVVDDEPENRWLSVCFYADMITDPDESGDHVPQGLMNEDACCFNLDEDNAKARAYIAARLAEALESAKAFQNHS